LLIRGSFFLLLAAAIFVSFQGSMELRCAALPRPALR
jgi:hypothetical protein